MTHRRVRSLRAKDGERPRGRPRSRKSTKQNKLSKHRLEERCTAEALYNWGLKMGER